MPRVMPQNEPRRIAPGVIDTFGEALDDPETNVLDIAWPYIAPQAAALERVRKAVLVMLAAPADTGQVRGRIHVLVHGEPGTGKSIVRNWVGTRIESATRIGPKTSTAGLKGDLRGGYVTPGALHTHHRGILALDELDEFDGADRKALLEALAEGEYQIDQAGVDRESFPAAVRVLGVCNRIADFAPDFLDRWDIIIELEAYDAAETVTVTERRYETFAEAYGDGDPSSAPNPVFGLIRWARTYTPTIARRDLARIQAMVNFLVREHDDAGDIRGKEAYLRVAYTIARLNHQALTPRHFLWAIELVEGSQLAVDELAAQFNVSRPEGKHTGIE